MNDVKFQVLEQVKNNIHKETHLTISIANGISLVKVYDI